MSQRVRAHTTGATPTPEPSRRQKSKADKKTQTTSAPISDFSAAASSDLTAPDQPTAQDSPAGIDAPALARVLRAVAQELERDPSLAQRVAATISLPAAPTSAGADADADSPAGGASLQERSPSGSASDEPFADLLSEEPEAPTGRGVNRSFQPRIVTGAPPELGPGVLDPFALFAQRGEVNLRATLAELRLGSLRAIVREYHLDAGGRVAKQNDAAKLRALIIGAVLAQKQATE